MKLKRKLLAGLLTLCMAVGMAVPAFAANGPLVRGLQLCIPQAR